MLPEWLLIAVAELGSGVQEIPGPHHSPRVLAYHRSTDLKATSDEIPWCSSFVSWVIESAGIPGTKSAAARSWLEWGREINDYPPMGSVVILRRGRGNQSGHVGFFYGTAGPHEILVLGGNQQNSVSIRPYERSSILGFRWPAISEAPMRPPPLARSS